MKYGQLRRIQADASHSGNAAEPHSNPAEIYYKYEGVISGVTSSTPPCTSIYNKVAASSGWQRRQARDNGESR